MSFSNQNHFQALSRGAQYPPSGGRGARGVRGGGGVAGGVLKQAGLIDEDSGMRDAPSAGPSRRGASAASTRAASRAKGAENAPMRLPDDLPTRARDRANPMAARGKRPRRGATSGGTTADAATLASHALGIKGVAGGGGGAGKGKGRVPGGGGAVAGAGAVPGASLPSTAAILAGAGGVALAASTSGASAGTGKTIALLRRFMQARWNAEARYLNLDRMAADPMLAGEGVKPPGTSGAHKDIGSVMWKLCRELFPGMTTLSLGSNDFKTLVPISTLPEFLPDLKNLSLEGNDIKWTRDLSFFHSKPGSRGNTQLRFTSLHELILNGNPVRDNAVAAGNEAGYRAEVLAKFPTLQLLDRVAVSAEERSFAQTSSRAGEPGADKSAAGATARGAAAAGVEARDFAAQIRAGFADAEAGRIVPDFLSKYFSLFDQDRSQLRAAYAPAAGFSCVQLHAVPPRARHAGYHHALPRQKELSWKGYSQVLSHNVLSLGTRPASKGFPRGPNAVTSTLQKLPATRHPLTEPAKFVVDAWVAPNAAVGAVVSNAPPQPAAATAGAGAGAGAGGATGAAGAASAQRPEAILFITVHGEFAEAPSYGLRSFSRTFVVAPAVPGSYADKAGWPCVILADELTVRQYAGSKAWVVDSLPVSGAGGGVGVGVGAAVGAALPAAAPPGAAAAPGVVVGAAGKQLSAAEQESLASELCARSGLTLPFAVQCLSENGWDAGVAWRNFESLRDAGAIPAEAFRPA